MSRRTILAGLASAAVGGIGGTGAPALALTAGDTRLLEIRSAVARAELWHNFAACDAGEEFSDPLAEAVAIAARDRAWDAREEMVRAMAAVPAAGMAGVAVKVLHLLTALGDGSSSADMEVANSLHEDLARLVPEVAA